jgi:iron complex outermembrane receptor protein
MVSKYTRILFILSAVAFAYAADTANISGTVIDPSGASVPHAKVNLRQIAGAGVISTETNNLGAYNFSGVAEGTYLLDASAHGLALARPLTITVYPGAVNRSDLRLVVTAISAQVSVTAAGEPQSVDEISKQLDVVGASEVEQRGLFSVADGVRYLPGVRVSTDGGPGQFTEIQTRGLRYIDTSVLIDGFRFRDPTAPQADASAFLGQLFLTDTSRIEVLQGSGSSLYGTQSMAGAINVITDRGAGPIHGDVDAQGGGLGLFQGVARVAGGALSNRLSYSAGLSNLNVSNGVDNWEAARDWSGRGEIGYALTPKIRISALFLGNTGYTQTPVSPQPTATAPTTGIIPAIPLASSEIALAAQNLPFSSGNATFIPELGDPDSGVYSHYLDSLFRVEHQVSSRLSYLIGYNIVNSVRDTRDGPGGPGDYQPQFNNSDKYLGRIDTVQAKVNYLWGSHQVLTAGYEFEQEHYRNVTSDTNPDPTQRVYNVTDARQRSNAVFAQDEIRLLSKRLDILLSGRFTQANLDQPAFVGATSPYAGIKLTNPPAAYTGDASIAYFFAATSTKIRAHAGNSFRLPSLYERFGGFLFDGVDYAYGDPRLAPERAVSGDFGFDQYLLRQKLKISGTYFYTRLQHVITYLSFPPGYVDPFGRSGGYSGAPGGISRGAEFSGDFRPTRKTSVFATYTYTNSKDIQSEYYTGLPYAPLQTPRILANQVSIIATQQFGKHVDLGMDFLGGSNFLYPLYGYAYQFTGPRQLGLDGGYSLNFTEKTSARFYFRISNALDQNFYENGFHTPQRWAVGGIHLAF